MTVALQCLSIWFNSVHCVPCIILPHIQISWIDLFHKFLRVAEIIIISFYHLHPHGALRGCSWCHAVSILNTVGLQQACSAPRGCMCTNLLNQTETKFSMSNILLCFRYQARVLHTLDTCSTPELYSPPAPQTQISKICQMFIVTTFK